MAKLTVVPTPIGNLEDMTFRAVDVLKSADMIYAEDTRTSAKLLKHFGIETPVRSYHMHNEHKIASAIAGEILSGQDTALISDAGTPSISDPGFLLVRTCIEKNIDVICLPGATAFVPALVISGLPADRFVFEGFLPHKKGRNKRLKALETETRTIIFYESPFRITKTLQQLALHLGGDRKAAVVREISKIYESVYRGSLLELAALAEKEEIKPKGEFVVIVGAV